MARAARCPILDRLGLRARRIGGTLCNLPPASVYRISREGSRARDGAETDKFSGGPGVSAALLPG
jgi:hypothetical protein